MISIIEVTTKMTDQPVVVPCLLAVSPLANSPLGVSLLGTGASGRLSSLSAAVLPVRERSERPAQAPAVAAVAAQVQAYAFAATTKGAETGGMAGNEQHAHQKTQHNPKWAFRGLEPWSDPA